MALYSYTMKHDYGFAPNPLWGYCTLAACTPNHQNAQAVEGDWIIGNSSKSDGGRLIYAMRVSEVLGFDSYFHDDRFEQKKPRLRRWQEQCGDNIYLRHKGEWIQHKHSRFHKEGSLKEKDLRYALVFISDHFFYFGENLLTLPDRFISLARIGRGIKRDHPADLVAGFVVWLESTYAPGVHGNPRDLGEWAEGRVVRCDNEPASHC